MNIVQNRLSKNGCPFIEIDQITTKEFINYPAPVPGVLQIRYTDWPGEFWFLHRGHDSDDPAWRAVSREEALQYIGESDETNTRSD